jgi:hypothetical protein
LGEAFAIPTAPIEVEGRFNAELQPVAAGKSVHCWQRPAGCGGDQAPASAGPQARPVLMFVLWKGPLRGSADRPRHRGFDTNRTTRIERQRNRCRSCPSRIGRRDCQANVRLRQGSAHPGDPGPGEPEVDLSPLTYNYSHRIPLEVIGPNGAGGAVAGRDAGNASPRVAADPFLGGLCDYFGIEAADFNDRSTEALASTNWATRSADRRIFDENPLG